jgi:hypothetical protein
MNILALPVVVMGKYTLKLIIFTEATPPKNTNLITYMKKHVSFGYILHSIAGYLLYIHICHIKPIKYNYLLYYCLSIISHKFLSEECNWLCVSWVMLD